MEFRFEKPFKILVVEDDLVSRTLLRGLLSKSSLPISQVEYAESLDVAFELLNKHRFDVVLLDLNLPDSRGLDTLVGISERHPYVALVVTTGEYGEDIGPKAVAMGAQEYLVKGDYNVDSLSKSIRYAIERKQTEEKLDRKQRNLEAIFDAAPIGMLLVAENMIVERANEVIKQMVHKEYSQIVNRQVGDVLGCINSTSTEKGCGYNPACAACLLQNSIESALKSEQSVRGVEVRPTLRLNNKEITPWLCISAEPTIIDGAKRAVVAINDITERKEAEEKLKETMEMKSQFISTVSHELRTPLACMREGVTIVLDGVVGQINNEQRNYLNIAKRNIEKLAMWVNDVLDFQKLEADKMKLNLQENDIKQVVQEVRETMTFSAKKKGIDLLFELEDDLPKVKFDSGKIVQVLENLISNAIKFTPNAGQVSVCLRCRGQNLLIRVQDTGMGIPQQDLTKIFERFYRVHRPGKRIPGTGLGLAIVKNIVEMHGGRIEVESEVNRGSTFTVFLPLDDKSVPEASPEEINELLEETIVND